MTTIIDADNERILKGKSYYRKERVNIRVYNLELSDLIENYKEYMKMGYISIQLNVLVKPEEGPIKRERIDSQIKVKERVFKHEFRDWSSLRLEHKEVKKNDGEVIFLKTTKTFDEVMQNTEDYKEQIQTKEISQNLLFEKNEIERRLIQANEALTLNEEILKSNKSKINFLREKIAQFCDEISSLESQLHAANILTKYMTLRHVDLHSIYSVYKEISEQKFECIFDEDKEYEQYKKVKKTEKRRSRVIFTTNIGDYLTEKLNIYKMNLKCETEKRPP